MIEIRNAPVGDENSAKQFHSGSMMTLRLGMPR